jgi:hypothetical protein
MAIIDRTWENNRAIVGAWIRESQRHCNSIKMRSNLVSTGSHLTRREDTAWGDDVASAPAANNDTFHFTNCCRHKSISRPCEY